MGKTTAISWTDSTFNLWVGCTKVGPGCDHCYAEAGNIRWSKGANWGPLAPRARTSEKYRAQLAAWNTTALLTFGRRRRVFVNSWSDIFDNEVPDEWRDAFWPVVEQVHNLEIQLVTKRIGNASKMVPRRWMEHGFPRNVIVIATVVDQDEFDRDWPKLEALPCRRGLSIEPQLGPITLEAIFDRQRQIGNAAVVPDWIIGGGESTQRQAARPYRLRWARELISECAFLRVPYFQKQLGGAPVHQFEDDIRFLKQTTDARARAIKNEWPADIQVQEFPR